MTFKRNCREKISGKFFGLKRNYMLNFVFAIILLFFMFYGDPDVFDLLREYAMHVLRNMK